MLSVVDPQTGRSGTVVSDLEAPAASLVAANPSGTRFLLSGPLGDFPHGWTLYEARPGESQLVPLAQHVRIAAWASRSRHAG